MPTWLGAKHSPDDTTVYQRQLLEDAEKAQFILQAVFNRLRRQLHKLAPPGALALVHLHDEYQLRGRTF